jgi:hypothetical protein
VCPRCHQNAPIVYRGVNAYCTACNQPRMPLANTSVNLAGQPSKVGGTVARVFGWIVLIAGSLLGAGLWATCQAILEGGVVGYVIGIPIMVISIVLGIVLLKSGKKLQVKGEDTEKATRNQAIFALANTRGGMLTPNDVAQSLSVTPQEADAILTDLAKGYPDYVNIDVDDNGVLTYRFSAAAWNAIKSSAAYVSREEHKRVAAQDGAPPVRVDARDPLEDELEPEPQAGARQVR